MSEDGEKSAPEVETISGNEKDRDLNIEAVKRKDAKVLAQTIQSQQRQIDRLENKIDELLNSLDDVRIEARHKDRKVLDEYPQEVKVEFMRRLKQSGTEGVIHTDLKSIFNVGRSRAYDLMSEIPQDYDKIARIERSKNEKDILIHKQSYLLELFDKYCSGIKESYEEKTGHPIDTTTIDELEDLFRRNANENHSKVKKHLDRMDEFF